MGLTRRRFLETTGHALAASALAPGALAAQAPKQRVAVVGTGVRGVGLWGRELLAEQSDVVDLVGLADINPGRLATAHRWLAVPDLPTFTDLGTMIEDTRPDRLIVTTRDDTHHEQIIQAMESGVDVITEKPLTTDPSRLRRIVEAQQRTGRDIVVTHNYRYSPHRQQMKEILQSGEIGQLTSVDFHWYLDIYHGAAYFRRWHGKERFSGSLWVHKACHHFDLLNWWIESDPELVFAFHNREFYGSNGPYRSDKCRGCPHASECDFFWDITKSERLTELYTKNEHHDGYIRDGCVFADDIDIPDKMAGTIRYANGVQVSYSLTTYSPYEGYRIAFNGTKGRLEAWIKERQPWEEPEKDTLRVTTNFGETRTIDIPHSSGGHGGGDTRMQNRIFRQRNEPDPLRQAAGLRDGAMAVLIGFAARKSGKTNQPVRIADIGPYTPHPTRGF